MKNAKEPGCPYLSEEDIEKIAERAADKAADKAVKKMTDQAYREIGKGVVNKFLWIVGVITVGFISWLAAWLHSRGFI